jgi:Leucine-rich repeat (LRR) protein
VIDISNNNLQSLTGVQHLLRLKRLICRNNKIVDLTPLHDLVMLVEADLQDNPIESGNQIVQAI